MDACAQWMQNMTVCIVWNFSFGLTSLPAYLPQRLATQNTQLSPRRARRQARTKLQKPRFCQSIHRARQYAQFFNCVYCSCTHDSFGILLWRHTKLCAGCTRQQHNLKSYSAVITALYKVQWPTFRIFSIGQTVSDLLRSLPIPIRQCTNVWFNLHFILCQPRLLCAPQLATWAL